MARKSTNRAISFALALYLSKNKADFDNHSIAYIKAKVAEEFQGEFISDAVLREALEACGITIKRKAAGRYNRGQSSRAIAMVLKQLIEKLESELGVTLVHPEAIHRLTQIVGGKSTES
jgi:hypothetical protein